MSAPILTTKLYIPRTVPRAVSRLRLLERLNEGLHGKLTLISAPAGFGKSTLVSEWAASGDRPIAWLSLDEGDSDPARFLTYLIAALQTLAPGIGSGLLGVLQAPQQPPIESILTILLNEIADIPDHYLLVLDDYHVVDSKAVDGAVTFLLEHMPLQMHLVIATREDPQIPLARLRAGGQLNELRDKDLRFTLTEAAEFLNRMIGPSLSAEDIGALEERTEGWIAGLQLAAISMQGHQDKSHFVQSFTGSHQFVMDYLVQEVLHQQPENIQTFLLQTSILNRLCGPLCDAVLLDAAAASQATLEYLERSNLFLNPLDNERRWYRYHHLFAELLRQRLQQSLASARGAERRSELHIRASQWFEDNNLDIEAFHHAAAANDIERAERLIQGRGIPLHLRGAVMAIIDWLESLPKSVKDARPSLWWRHGTLLLVNGHTTGVEEKLDAAEAALQGREPDEKIRPLLGGIATARAVLALTRYQPEVMIAQSRRALAYLDPGNLAAHATPYWTLGIAYFYQRDLVEARRALTQAITLSQPAGDIFTTILATIGLGAVQEADNQLYQAAETYRRVLQAAGDQPLQIISEAQLGMARILYEWNNLDGAEELGLQSLHLSRQYDRVIDRFIIGEIFLARVKLARGDVDDTAALLARTEQTARQQNFVHRLAEVASAQVLILLRQGYVEEAARLAHSHDLLLSRARVSLAQGNPAGALTALDTWREQVEAKGWQDERLRGMVLQAVALHAHGDMEGGVQVLGDALALAKPGGFIRLFVDEGEPMRMLLTEAAAQGITPDYTGKLLAAFGTEAQGRGDSGQPLIDPLSQRELEILRLIAQGLTNHEIGEQLYLALDTVKGHNRRIFDKLQVRRRTEAVARARELGLLSEGKRPGG